MILPESLEEIEAGAFVGADMNEVILPDGCRMIGSNVFADCAELRVILIPESVSSIAADAFTGCSKISIVCYAGSAAAAYALTNGIPCVIM